MTIETVFLTIAQLATNPHLEIRADIEGGLALYEENEKRFGIEGEMRIQKKTPKVVIKGETRSYGFNKNPWKFAGKAGTAYSVDIELDQTELDAFEFLVEKMEEFLESNNLKGWKVMKPFKGEKMTVKVKTETIKAKDNYFVPKINGKRVTESKIDSIGLDVDQNITFYGGFEPFFKFKEQRVEFNFVVRSVNFTPVETST